MGCAAGVDDGVLVVVSPLVGAGSDPFWAAARSRMENEVIRLKVAAALFPAAR